MRSLTRGEGYRCTYRGRAGWFRDVESFWKGRGRRSIRPIAEGKPSDAEVVHDMLEVYSGR